MLHPVFMLRLMNLKEAGRKGLENIDHLWPLDASLVGWGLVRTFNENDQTRSALTERGYAALAGRLTAREMTAVSGLAP